MTLRILIFALVFVAAPAAAAAGDGNGIQIPEPSNMALMAMGLVGLIVGRHAARNKRSRDDTTLKD
jgi:hypothetical protein